MEKLEGEVSFPRENFSERSEVLAVQIEEKKNSLEEKKSLRFFLSKSNLFQQHRYIFSSSGPLTNHKSITSCTLHTKLLGTSISFTFL